MKLKRFLSKPQGVLVAGTMVSGLVMVLGLTPLMNPPQCPDSYTQQQVDASNCIIGANIGAGLVAFLAIAIFVCVLVVAGAMLFSQKIQHKQAGNLQMSAPSREHTAGEGRWPQPAIAGLTVIGLFLLSQVISAIVVGVLVSLTGEASSKPRVLFGSPVLLQFAFVLFAEAAVLGGLAWLLRRLRIGLKDLGLVRPKLSDLGWAVVAFAVYISLYVILVSVIAPLVPGLDINQKQDTGFGGATGVVPLVLVFLALVVLAPVTEEVLMRGFLFGAVRRRTRFWIAAAVTSVIFASLHLGGGEQGAGLLWIAAIDTFILSLVLCYLREKTGRLWASIGLHALKNGVAFMALFIFVT